MSPVPQRADAFPPVLLVWMLVYLVRYFVGEFNSDRDPANVLKNAQQDVENGNLVSAETNLRKLVKRMARKQGDDSIELAVHLRQLAQVLQSEGKWQDARATMQRSLSIEEKNLGPGSADLVSTMYWLINQPEAEGDAATNLALMRRIVGIHAITRGTDDFEYGAALNFLGVMLTNAEQYPEAESVTRDALLVLEKHREKFAPYYATTLSNLAVLLVERNDVAAAEELHRQALAIWDEPVNANHPGVSFTLNGLASLLQQRDAVAEAKELYRRLLVRKEQEFGPDSPQLVGTLVNHAMTLRDMNDHDAAFEEFKRAENLQVQVPNGQFGFSYILSHLASIERQRGALPESLALVRRVLALRRSTLAATDPAIAQALGDESWLLWQLRELPEAEQCMRQCIDILEPLPDYRALRSVNMFNLGLLLKDKSDLAAAEAMLWKALKIEEEVFGADNIESASTLYELGFLRAAHGDLKVAETVMRQSLATREKLLRPAHPLLATTLVGLAGVLSEKGSAVEREALLRRALWIYEQALGSDHHTVGATLTQLGRALQDHGRYDEAEPLYRRALKIAEAMSGPEHADTGVVLASLGSLLDDKGDFTGGRLLLTRALSISVEALGADHPTTVSIRERLSSSAFKSAAPQVN
jgi:tetratricopeptide (TPR) repeat protein